MVNDIQIKNVASFGDAPVSLNGLSTFNYFFGANGTGKTTISRLIADEASGPDCRVTWQGGIKQETQVYNRDFIDRNFGQSAEIKGIFTLGEKDKTILEKITKFKEELDEIEKLGKKLRETLQGVEDQNGHGGKNGELESLESEFAEECWQLKKRHEVNLGGAFKGSINSKEKFKLKLLAEAQNNTATSTPLIELEKRAETLFGEAPQAISPLVVVNFEKIQGYEGSPILKKKIIGKTDVDIAAMILKLGNSDWVKSGRGYFDKNDGICPFCQQKVKDSLSRSLSEYFDEQFVKDTATLSLLLADYKTESERLLALLQAIVDSAPKYLDVEKLKMDLDLLKSKTDMNIQLIEKKQREASQSIELESISNIVNGITAILTSVNAEIKKHNGMVSNLFREKEKLTNEVWRYLLDNEIKTQLESFTSEKNKCNKAIEALNQKIEQSRVAYKTKRSEIQKLEKNTTSVEPTIVEINKLLASFGFSGFSLAKADKPSHYKIIRANGLDAKETLSEGEKTFITFLYFYHLLNGSELESGVSSNRVVVFDDPVSSLDSDILFVVSNLIRDLMVKVRKNEGNVKQVFILTHNVYFHKEITFDKSRGDTVKGEETFWLVKKSNSASAVQKCVSNPVKTSYDLLWSDVRNPDKTNPNLQNTLRRIIENYFKILGGIDIYELSNSFNGQEKVIFGSLISWVNDGSHFSGEDIFMTIDSTQVDMYLSVFRKVFDKMGQISHYKMMMGSAYVDDQNGRATPSLTSSTVTAL